MIDLARLVDKMRENQSFFNTSQKLCYFTLTEIKCIVLQLATAISHLHANNIVHRDLKLSNMLLTATGVLKLADFGLARQMT
jgi:serine/threonine protein kinase